MTRYPTVNVIYNRGQNYSSAGIAKKKKKTQSDPHRERYGRVQSFIFSEDSGVCDVMLSRWASGYQPTFHLNTLRTGEADLRFYVATVQDG